MQNPKHICAGCNYNFATKWSLTNHTRVPGRCLGSLGNHRQNGSWPPQMPQLYTPQNTQFPNSNTNTPIQYARGIETPPQMPQLYTPQNTQFPNPNTNAPIQYARGRMEIVKQIELEKQEKSDLEIAITLYLGQCYKFMYPSESEILTLSKVTKLKTNEIKYISIRTRDKIKLSLKNGITNGPCTLKQGSGKGLGIGLIHNKKYDFWTKDFYNIFKRDLGQNEINRAFRNNTHTNQPHNHRTTKNHDGQPDYTCKSSEWLSNAKQHKELATIQSLEKKLENHIQKSNEIISALNEKAIAAIQEKQSHEIAIYCNQILQKAQLSFESTGNGPVMTEFAHGKEKFGTNQELIQSVLNIKTNLGLSLDAAKRKIKNSQKATCPFCHKTLSRKRDLDRHVQTIHLRGNTSIVKLAALQCATSKTIKNHEDEQNMDETREFVDSEEESSTSESSMETDEHR